MLAFAVALFFTVSLSANGSSNNIDLASLTKISEANAECASGPYLDGRCNDFSGHCFQNPFPEDQNCNTFNSTW